MTRCNPFTSGDPLVKPPKFADDTTIIWLIHHHDERKLVVRAKLTGAELVQDFRDKSGF